MSTNLLDYRKNKYSQEGQDGIIEHIFSVLGIKKGHFVEFGAWDGIFLSNCRKLFEEGWSGVFIEPVKSTFYELQKNYDSVDRIKCINERVEIRGQNTLDNILTKHTSGKPVTFLSIDVDGLDLEIFESIEKYLPMVACIEGGQGPHPLDPRMPTSCISFVGQSLKVIRDAAEKKGYKVLCAFQDIFLIKKELFSKFNPPSDLFQLYINGYKAQEYITIPTYVGRLKTLHRKNRILDYILKETGYHNKYQVFPKDTDVALRQWREWVKENKQQISDILTSSLPGYLYDAQTKDHERIIINLMNLRSEITERRCSNNFFWKSLFYIKDYINKLLH